MSLRKQATSGLFWTFGQQFGNQAISFIISIILARLLLPAEFGLIGMVAVFIVIGRTLVDVGLTQSLIRNEATDQEDLSTVFFFNLIASILIYFVLFISAPLIAQFYDQNILTDIIRVISLTFVIGAFGAIQNTRLTKIMDFKTKTIISVPSVIGGGVIGVGLAYSGFGVWSLVWSRVAESLISTVQLWIYTKWYPSFNFNIQKFKYHFNFGYKLGLSSLLDTVFNNIYVIVIGKYFAASQVGFYTRAESLQKLPVANISKALNKVTYPLFAEIQDDNERLKRVYKQIMQTVVFLIAPILIFTAVLAEPIFILVLTEKWLPAVPYFQILCVSGILQPINSYNLNVLKVKGRSDLFLKLEVIKKIIIAISIIVAIQYGIYGLLYSHAIFSIIAFFINSYNTEKFISYSTLEQTMDILPIILLTLLSGSGIYFMDSLLISNDFSLMGRIVIGGLVGCLIYIPLIHLTKPFLIKDLLTLISKK